MGCAAPNPLHWEDLRNRPESEILAHEGVTPAANGGGYEVTFLNAVYLVDHQQEIVRELSPKPDRMPTEQFQILLIRYLVSEYGGPVTGKEISEKDLPGGVTFFQGPHTLHLAPIAERFGRDSEGFKELAGTLGAVSQEHGDCSMKFFPFPLIPVTYILWEADDEFPASVSALFDDSIGNWFELDMVFTLVLALTARIMEE